jgi:Mn-dependent DtxR family transcriptional regulator
MDLQTRKITFVQEFLRLQNEEIISGLEHLLREKKAEQINKSLTPMSIDQFNSEIDQSMKDSVEGRLTSAKDLKKKTRKWS